MGVYLFKFKYISLNLFQFNQFGTKTYRGSQDCKTFTSNHLKTFSVWWGRDTLQNNEYKLVHWQKTEDWYTAYKLMYWFHASDAAHH